MGNFYRQMTLSSALLRSRRGTVAAVSLGGARAFTTTEGHRPTIIHKRSLDILHDPWFNKVSAYENRVFLIVSDCGFGACRIFEISRIRFCKRWMMVLFRSSDYRFLFDLF